VNYATAAAFRTALERRLIDRSRETSVALVRLRKAVVFDRLLARLVAVAATRGPTARRASRASASRIWLISF
jgi:hypothetical protein